MNTICNIQDLNKKTLYNLLFILPFLLLIVMFFFVIFRNGDVFTPPIKRNGNMDWAALAFYSPTAL